MNYKVVTAATIYPVQSDEVKTHLRVDTTAEDAYISTLIQAATIAAENYCYATFLTTSYKLYLNEFPGYSDCNMFYLPRPVIQTDTPPVVKYYDGDNTLQTLDTSEYYVSVNTGAIHAPNGFPSTYNRVDAVEVTFTAGETAAATVQAPIKHAILLLIGAMYVKREDTIQRFPTAAENLLMPYKNPKL